MTINTVLLNKIRKARLQPPGRHDTKNCKDWFIGFPGALL